MALDGGSRQQLGVEAAEQWRPSPTVEAETDPTNTTRKPKSQDPGEADCILLVSPVDSIFQNTHFRLPSKMFKTAYI